MVTAGSRGAVLGTIAAVVAAMAMPARADEPVDVPASPGAAPLDPAATPRDAEPPLVPRQGVRRKDASVAEIMRGPYRPSQLFTMPIADVVGAYQMMLSGDGSLLEEQGILSFAGVAAIGFGDLAQLEFRHTAAISLERTNAPLPTLGVQLKLPIPEKPYVPSFALAFRYGLQRQRTVGASSITESVTDGYLVARLALHGAAEGVSLHAGLRVSQARMEVDGVVCDPAQMDRCPEYLVLPTFGLDVETGRNAQLIVEAGRVPRFSFDTATPGSPTPRISHGLLGRLGVRWFLHPAFALDATMGYQVVGTSSGEQPRMALTDVIAWDIRLGAQMFVPWGGFACRQMGLFCD